jgi:hypothetical protein
MPKYLWIDLLVALPIAKEPMSESVLFGTGTGCCCISMKSDGEVGMQMNEQLAMVHVMCI